MRKTAALTITTLAPVGVSHEYDTHIPTKKQQSESTPEQRITDLNFLQTLMEESAGKIAAEFVYLYPPGIPIIVPGEQITGLFTRNVRRYMEQGLNIHGLCGENNETISVVKEQAEV